MTDCEHTELEFNPEVESVDVPKFTFVSLAVRCTDCQVMFHWRGVASGKPNPDEPTVTADGYLLRAPILPGPGAVVGLLEKTGLADRLVKP